MDAVLSAVPKASVDIEAPSSDEKLSPVSRRRYSLGSEKPDDAAVVMKLQREDFVRFLCQRDEAYSKLATTSMKREKQMERMARNAMPKDRSAVLLDVRFDAQGQQLAVNTHVEAIAAVDDYRGDDEHSRYSIESEITDTSLEIEDTITLEYVRSILEGKRSNASRDFFPPVVFAEHPRMRRSAFLPVFHPVHPIASAMRVRLDSTCLLRPLEAILGSHGNVDLVGLAQERLQGRILRASTVDSSHWFAQLQVDAIYVFKR